MKNLIEALQIFLKYADRQNPTHCEHDMLCVVDIPKDDVESEDVLRLGQLGFFWSEEYECWASFRYGSA